MRGLGRGEGGSGVGLGWVGLELGLLWGGWGDGRGRRVRMVMKSDGRKDRIVDLETGAVIYKCLNPKPLTLNPKP